MTLTLTLPKYNTRVRVVKSINWFNPNPISHPNPSFLLDIGVRVEIIVSFTFTLTPNIHLS